jgi:hypothetical protein
MLADLNYQKPEPAAGGEGQDDALGMVGLQAPEERNPISAGI